VVLGEEDSFGETERAVAYQHGGGDQILRGGVGAGEGIEKNRH